MPLRPLGVVINVTERAISEAIAPSLGARELCLCSPLGGLASQHTQRVRRKCLLGHGTRAQVCLPLQVEAKPSSSCEIQQPGQE